MKLYPLTRNELEVLRLAGCGNDNSDIALSMGLRASNVWKMRRNAYRKLFNEFLYGLTMAQLATKYPALTIEFIENLIRECGKRWWE